MSDKREPVIHFGGVMVPAHQIWDKLETASAVNEAIHRFNEEYPHLATRNTLAAVPLVRERLDAVEVCMPPRPEKNAELEEVAAALLASLPPEEVLEALARDHGCECDLHGLIYLAGEEAYVKAMGREAREYEQNRILPAQTAELWNEARRPAPGGGLWTEKKVRQLFD